MMKKNAYMIAFGILLLSVAGAAFTAEQKTTEKKKTLSFSERIKANGLVESAFWLSESQNSIHTALPSGKTTSIGKEEVLKVSQQVAQYLACHSFSLSTSMVGLAQEEYQKTLKGFHQLVVLMEKQKCYRTTLCAIKLRTLLLPIVCARGVGTGQAAPKEAKWLYVSLREKQFSGPHIELLRALFPKWKKELDTLTLPLRNKDYYALYNLDFAASNKNHKSNKPWPNTETTFVKMVIYNKPKIAKVFSGGTPPLLDYVRFTMHHEFQYIMAIHLNKLSPYFPKNKFLTKEKFVEIAPKALGEDDMFIPMAERKFDSKLLWSSYKTSCLMYQSWKKMSERAKAAKAKNADTKEKASPNKVAGSLPTKEKPKR